ncbi:MAG TPA: hypothetical protein VIC26_13990 [Marinagarivorans sp.]
MSNRKAPERRVTTTSSQTSSQDNNDLGMAITELHQTIVRLNKVIDRVKPEPQHAPARKPLNAASQSLTRSDDAAAAEELCLASLNIPRVLH